MSDADEGARLDRELEEIDRRLGDVDALARQLAGLLTHEISRWSAAERLAGLQAVTLAPLRAIADDQGMSESSRVLAAILIAGAGDRSYLPIVLDEVRNLGPHAILASRQLIDLAHPAVAEVLVDGIRSALLQSDDPHGDYLIAFLDGLSRTGARLPADLAKRLREDSRWQVRSAMTELALD
jgi:hypothetical protein